MSNTSVLYAKLCLLLLLLSSAIPVAWGKLVNVTVDDQLGDTIPTYSPSEKWKEGPQCTTCFAHPDASHAFKGIWHDATTQVGDQPHVITYTFNGSAVFAYVILANKNSLKNTTAFTNLSFTLDGLYEGNYVHEPDESDLFNFNVSVFAMAGLENSEHTVAIYNNAIQKASLVLFDYLTYTTDDGSGSDEDGSSSSTTDLEIPPSSTVFASQTSIVSARSPRLPDSSSNSNQAPEASSSSISVKAIIGISTVGAIVGLALGAIITIFYFRRKMRIWNYIRHASTSSRHSSLSDSASSTRTAVASYSGSPGNQSNNNLRTNHSLRWWGAGGNSESLWKDID